MGTKTDKIKVLVTGGGGFIGMALVRRLVALGYDVSVFSRNIYPEHKKMNVTVFQGDISNLTQIEKACNGIDALFHVAAKVGFAGTYSEFYETNVIGTGNIIEACYKNGVRKLIFTSSASVVFGGSHLEGVDETAAYPKKHRSFYTSTKADAEQMVLKANTPALKTVALRPHLVWGPGDTQLIPKILRRAKSGNLRKPCKKDHWIDITYIDNLVDAQLLALKKMDETLSVCGRPFFITNGEPVKTWDFLNAFIQFAGLPPIRKKIPKCIALFIAWLAEKKSSLLYRGRKEPFIFRFVIHELCTHHWFNINAAKDMLDYRPKIGFNEGILKWKEFLHN